MSEDGMENQIMKMHFFGETPSPVSKLEIEYGVQQKTRIS